MDFNPLDLFFIAVLVFVLVRGLFRGLVREIASVAGLVIAFLLANRFHAELAEFLHRWVQEREYAEIASYLAIFIGTMILIYLVALALRSVLKAAMLGGADRLGGGVVGLLKGIVFCSVVLLVLTTFLPPKSEILRTSKTAPYIQIACSALVLLVPEKMQDEFRSRSKSLKELWEGDWLEKLKEKTKALGS